MKSQRSKQTEFALKYTAVYICIFGDFFRIRREFRIRDSLET